MLGSAAFGILLLGALCILAVMSIIFSIRKGYRLYKNNKQQGYIGWWILAASIILLIVWFYTWREKKIKENWEANMCNYYNHKNEPYSISTKYSTILGYDTANYAGTTLHLDCNSKTFWMSKNLPFIEDSAGTWEYDGCDDENTYINIRYNNGHMQQARALPWEWFFDNPKPRIGQKPVKKVIFYRPSFVP